MKRFILVSLIFALLCPALVSAKLCIPVLGGQFPECDPANGEPPSWCGEYEGGNWLEGGPYLGMWLRRLRYNLDQALGADPDVPDIGFGDPDETDGLTYSGGSYASH